jgi:hypothetical protein
VPRRCWRRGRFARQQIARPFSPSVSTANPPPTMGDTTFILISLAFFALAIAYVYGCEKLR